MSSFVESLRGSCNADLRCRQLRVLSAATGGNPKGYPQGADRSRSCGDRPNFPNDCHSNNSGALRISIYNFHAFEDGELRTTFSKSRSRSQEL